MDERTGTVTFVVWNEGSFYWFSLLGLQKLDTPIKGGGRPRLRAGDGFYAMNRARRRAPLGGKAGSAKMVEIVKYRESSILVLEV